jgi:riboflavin biosynthesis pyrimidine reductase
MTDRLRVGGDSLVVVHAEQVTDAHLGGLRNDGVSCIFGEQELDLRLALEILDRELGIKRLLVESGGSANALRAGLIDEISSSAMG